MYDVVYLPKATEQLESIVMYIANELHALEPAYKLLDKIDAAVSDLSIMPYRHSIYPLLQGLTHEVRFFPVDNYNIYYWVNEENKTVEILRILYKRQNQ